MMEAVVSQEARRAELAAAIGLFVEVVGRQLDELFLRAIDGRTPRESWRT